MPITQSHKRNAELTQLRIPYAKVVTVIGLIGSISTIKHKVGNQYIGICGLLVAAYLSRYLTTNYAIEMFCKRVIALTIDITLLALTTFGAWTIASMMLMFRQTALLNMLILWGWIIIIIITEWRYSGTIGLHIVGM